MRRIGNERSASVVEASELPAHALERGRELAELVPRPVVDRLLEVAGRDPVGRTLEPPDAAREDRGGAEADDERQPERDEPRPEQAHPYQVDVLEGVSERRCEEEHVAVAVGDRDFGIGVPAALHAAALDARAGGGAQRNRVENDVLREREMGGVEDRRERRLSAAERVEVHDPRVGRPGLLVDEVLVGRRGNFPRDRPRRGRKLRQPPVDETPLERRHECDPDDGERAGDDDRQSQGQAGADAPEGIHARAR